LFCLYLLICSGSAQNEQYCYSPENCFKPYCEDGFGLTSACWGSCVKETDNQKVISALDTLLE